jgi:hypothetical protein
MPSDLTTPIPEKLVRKFGGPELASVEAAQRDFILA